MSFPAYSSYKNIGVEWLGEVPDHWVVQRLKNSVEVARNGIWGDEAQLDETDIICVRVADFDRNAFRVKLESPTSRSISTKDRLGRILLPGDLLLEKSGGGEKQPVGSVVMYDHLEPAVCSNFIARVVLAPGMHSRFWCYVHAAAYSLRLTVGSINQTSGIQNLDQSRYFEEQAPFPPPQEQAAIAAFLDHETAKIDALMEEQRRLITLLKEKRQAVVSHAVTKGLNPAAPMKDSGIEWLGEVPAHWEVRKLKGLVKRGSSISYGIVQPGEHQEGGVPFVQTTNMTSGTFDLDVLQRTSREIAGQYPRSLLSGGEVILGIRASIGAAHVAPSHLEGANLSRGVARIECSGELDPQFLVSFLGSAEVNAYWQLSKQGSTFNEVSIDTVKNIYVATPPCNEQRHIITYVNKVTERFQSLGDAAEEAILLLQERRSSLISSAVTGKIDVRGSSKKLSFPAERGRIRALVATEIIERLVHYPTFGRVKLQKIAYLAETHVGVTELNGVYLREAAGPLDREMIRDMEREAGTLAGIRLEQAGGVGSAVAYRLGHQRGTHRQDLAALLGDRAEKLDKLIEDIGTIDTKGAEAVATLYAVWNDALIDGEMPSDMEIKLALLSEWHPEKARKFRIDELQIWLDWMRRHGLVPTGAGSKTSTGRLFA